MTDLGGAAPASDELHADCANCFALCCVAPAFSASSDFAMDKPAGRACPNLRTDFGCGIHTQLRPRGFAGCTVYDCFGAGQQVSQHTFGGRDWRTAPGTARQMFTVFPIVRDLHELLWYLTQASGFVEAQPLHPDLDAARDLTRKLADRAPAGLLDIDVAEHRRTVNQLLVKASELVRATYAAKGRTTVGPTCLAPSSPEPGCEARAFAEHYSSAHDSTEQICDWPTSPEPIAAAPISAEPI